MQSFNENGAAIKNSGIFGLLNEFDKCKVILLPIPWDATASMGKGTASAPKKILEMSKFQELYDTNDGSIYELGIFMLQESKKISRLNEITKKMTNSIIEKGGENLTSLEKKRILQINNNCLEMNSFVYRTAAELLDKDKLVATIGGDHSVIQGVVSAYVKKYPKLGLLHIDAHADLRSSFEGLKFSHASIIHNIIEENKSIRVVQVGLRALCKEEYQCILSSKKIKAFFQSDMDESKLKGIRWNNICSKIVKSLPKEIYISLDVDALQHKECPGTGTPVPGGMSYEEVIHLFKSLVKAKNRIVGFDIVETGTSNWDAIVASDLIYKLCGLIKRQN